MSAAHTAGPWFRNGLSIEAKISRGFSQWIGSCDSRESNDPDEDIANARLIAAAPDLLAALRFLLDQCESAIASQTHTGRPLTSASNAIVMAAPLANLARAAIAKAEVT
jgi:hypothetical protein